MRQTLLILLVVSGGLVQAREAAASCAVDAAYWGADHASLGCAITVYRQPGHDTAPAILAERGGAFVDVTGTVAREPSIAVPIWFEDDACTGAGHSSELPFEVYVIELTDAVEGDRLILRDELVSSIVIGPPAECPLTYLPELSCPDEDPQPCPDEGSGDGALGVGCSTLGDRGGLGALGTIGLALALIALGRRRP
jgi:hypothetical protein